MNDKCEICGCTSGLTQVYACACDEDSPSATLCEKCRKKYFECNVLPGVPTFLQYNNSLGYAENLVFAHKVLPESVFNTKEKEEANTMQVTYNGFTGELVKLEREDLRAFGMKDRVYNLSIYDSEKQVTHSFTGVKLEDVKFSGGVVSFGG